MHFCIFRLFVTRVPPSCDRPACRLPRPAASSLIKSLPPCVVECITSIAAKVQVQSHIWVGKKSIKRSQAAMAHACYFHPSRSEPNRTEPRRSGLSHNEIIAKWLKSIYANLRVRGPKEQEARPGRTVPRLCRLQHTFPHFCSCNIYIFFLGVPPTKVQIYWTTTTALLRSDPILIRSVCGLFGAASLELGAWSLELGAEAVDNFQLKWVGVMCPSGWVCGRINTHSGTHGDA